MCGDGGIIHEPRCPLAPRVEAAVQGQRAILHRPCGVSKKANSTEDLIEITKAAQPRASTIQRPGTARMVAGLRNSVAGPSDGFYASGGFEEFSTDPVAEFSRPFNAGGQGGPSQVMTLSPVQQSPPPKEEAKGKSKKGGGFSLFSKDNVRR